MKQIFDYIMHCSIWQPSSVYWQFETYTRTLQTLLLYKWILTLTVYWSIFVRSCTSSNNLYKLAISEIQAVQLTVQHFTYQPITNRFSTRHSCWFYYLSDATYYIGQIIMIYWKLLQNQYLADILHVLQLPQLWQGMMSQSFMQWSVTVFVSNIQTAAFPHQQLHSTSHVQNIRCVRHLLIEQMHSHVTAF